jgi:Protein of unknown function (DUF3352)
MRPRVVAIVVGALMVLAGVGAAGVLAWQFFFAPATDTAVELVPRDAFVYGNVFLSPSSGQKRAISNLLDKFPAAPSPEEAKNKLTDALDEGLAEIDANFKDDVEPWLGNQIAGFALAPASVEDDPEGALLIASKNNDAAESFLEKAIENASDTSFSDETYEDVDYHLGDDGSATGIVDDFVVIGSEGGFKAVVDVDDDAPNLSESDRFNDTVDRLTDDRLATIYFDGKELSDFLDQSAQFVPGFDPTLFGGFGEPVGVALFAASDKVVFETSAKVPDEGAAGELAKAGLGSDILARLPERSWGAFGIGNSGEWFSNLYNLFAEGFGVPSGQDADSIGRQFEAQTGLNLEDDIFGWMGDLGIFVEGTTIFEVAGGVVIETTDPATSSATVETVGELLGQQGAPVGPLQLEGLNGFSVQQAGVPQPVNVVASEDRVVIAYGNSATQDALGSQSTLESNQTFQEATEALGEGFKPSGFFDAQAIITLVENIPGPTEDATYKEDVKPWLDPLGFLTFGSKEEDGRILQRIVLGVK